MKVPGVLSILLASIALATSATGQGQLWVVGPVGTCPGVRFDQVQKAIDAASDGDTILVVDPKFPNISVVGKSLSLIADPSLPKLQGLFVRNLAPGQVVTFQGFEAEKVLLQSNAGTVWLEDCTVENPPPGSSYAVRATDCAALVVVRCNLLGIPGLNTKDTVSYLYDSTVRGYDGLDASFLPLMSGTAGGIALAQQGGFLYATGSEIRGGDGGDFDLFVCGWPGAPALFMTAEAVAEAQDTVIVGGLEGLGSCFGGDGLPVDGASAAGFQMLPGSARSLVPDSSEPVNALSNWSVKLKGEDSDLVLLTFALNSQPLFLPELAGAYLPSLPSFSFFIGVLPASGELPLSLGIGPGLVTPGMALEVFFQPVFIDLTGTVFLGAPAVLDILDQAFAFPLGC